MAARDWESPSSCALGLLLGGDALDTRDVMGSDVTGESFLLLMNGARTDVPFSLPRAPWAAEWVVRIDTRERAALTGPITTYGPQASILLVAQSMLVLQRRSG
jgi:glycogen operon protein